MMNKFFLILCCLVLVAGVAGCDHNNAQALSDDSEEGSDNQEDDSSQPDSGSSPNPPPNEPGPQCPEPEPVRFLACFEFNRILERPEVNRLDGYLNIRNRNEGELPLYLNFEETPPSATHDWECDLVDALIEGTYDIIQELTAGAVLSIHIVEDYTQDTCTLTQATATVTFSDGTAVNYNAVRGYTTSYGSTLQFTLEFEMGTINGIVVAEMLGGCL